MIHYENLGLLNQKFSQELELTFQEALQEGWFIEGRYLQKFEDEFAQYCQVKHCVGISNGLDALKLALISLDLPPQSEVILSAHTFIASILAVIHAGLKPVLIEPDIHSYNIDPLKVEEKITPNTKVLMPIHLYGKVCNMEAITDIAQKYQLTILEDAAQAHGAKYKNKIAGSFGTMAAFSFYPAKNLGALGDAGAVLTNHNDKKLKVRKLRSYGATEKYQHEVNWV